MPTDKQRLSVTFPDGMFSEIVDYQKSHGFSSSSKAIVDLINKGIESFSAGKPAEARLLELFGQLNDEGQGRLIETADDMVRSGKYLTPEEADRLKAVAKKAVEKAVELEYYREYFTPAAAGFASPIEGEDYRLVPRDDKTPRNADYAVRIRGDSMEPFIKNGDIVFVQRDATLDDGDAGIFFLDGDVLCKQLYYSPYGDAYLVSANPRRQDLNRTVNHNSSSTLVCLGKVLLPGKLPVPKAPYIGK